MDPNHILLWIVGTTSASWLTLFMFRYRLQYPGWLAVNTVVLGIGAGGLLAFPQYAGYASGAVWFALVLAPLWLGRWIQRLVLRQDYARARWPATIFARLHPWDGGREQPQFIRILALIKCGNTGEAEALLAGLQESDTVTGRVARLQLYRIGWRWGELKSWVVEHPRSDSLLRDPVTLGMYLRALGETGDLETMLGIYARHADHTVGGGALEAMLNRLFVTAFTGRVEIVDALLVGPLVTMPAGQREFWRATAEQAAGRIEAARERLLRLEATDDPSLRTAVARRLAAPATVSDSSGLKLSPAAGVTLGRIERDIDHLRRFGTIAEPPAGRAIATHVLIALNIAMFLAELPGGSTDLKNLHRLGALLIPVDYLHGEWWRLATAGFLHYGFAHLVLNMLAFRAFGRYVERQLGPWRLAFAYAASGLGCLAAVVGIATWLGSPPGVMVGASGSVLGILGVYVAILASAWYRDRARIARGQLVGIAFLLGLQAVFDLVTPHVSSTAHVAGFLIGLAAGYVLMRRERLAS